MSETDSSESPGDEGQSSAEADPLVGTLIAQRYRVDERLGVGGMGAVYRAEHVLMRKPVAVKVLHREMTAMQEVVKRFELEAIAAGRIDHPNVTVATDFGIAKVNAEGASSPLTRIGSVFGTPAYMAPEQAAGQPVDHRADLYSLGLVLYEMLAGKPAFESEDIVGLLSKQLTEPPPALPPAVGADVAALVMKLCQKDPAARVESAEALLLEIDAILGAIVVPADSTSLGIPSPRAVGSAPTAVAALTSDVDSLPSTEARHAGGPELDRGG